MQIASRELCQQLYKLKPEWDDTDYVYYIPNGNMMLRNYKLHTTEEYCSAYDLGWLLRKLPKSVELSYLGHREKWRCRTSPDADFLADTPEDAAAKLAISLIKAEAL